MNAKHTPGPWHTSKKNKYIVYCNIGQRVANSFESIPVLSRSDAECEANAKLIAAAPDLLDALRMVISCAGDISELPDGLLEMALDDDDEETRNRANAFLKARAAIFKATGGAA